MKRIIGLDYIRGISAIMIVLYHYTYRYSEVRVGQPDYIQWPYTLSWGCMAVITFFMISGYLTGRTLGKQTNRKQFLIKRFKRLYPTFWCGMVITAIACYCLKQETITVKQFFLNLTMIPAIFGENAIDGVYWTQQFEIIFYAIFVAFFANRNETFTKYILLVWLFFSIPFYYYQVDHTNLLVRFIRVFGIPEYNSAFILGLSLNIKRCRTLIQTLSVVNFYLWHNMFQTIFMAIIFVIVAYVTNHPDSIVNKASVYLKPIVFIAGISYPLYLIHQKIGMSIISVMIERLGWTNEMIILIPMLVCGGIAYLLHELVETRIK